MEHITLTHMPFSSIVHFLTSIGGKKVNKIVLSVALLLLLYLLSRKHCHYQSDQSRLNLSDPHKASTVLELLWAREERKSWCPFL